MEFDCVKKNWIKNNYYKNLLTQIFIYFKSEIIPAKPR